MSKFTREDFEQLVPDGNIGKWIATQKNVAIIKATLRIAARAMDREKIAREIARVRGGSNLWKTWLPVADAIIAMLTEDKP